MQPSAEEAHRRLVLALEAGATGIWELDVASGIYTWDAVTAELHGITELVGTAPIRNLLLERMHPLDLTTAVTALAAAIEAVGSCEAEYRMQAPGGGHRWVMVRGRVLADETGTPVRMIGTAVDVTHARTQVTQRLEAASRTAALASVASRLAETRSELQITEVVTTAGLELLGADDGGVSLLSPDRTTLRAAGVARRGAGFAGDAAELPLDDALPAAYAARTGEPVLLPTRTAALSRFPALAELHTRSDVAAMIAVPLRARGVVLGSLNASWAREVELTGEDQELLSALAAQCAQALVRVAADRERDLALAQAQASQAEANAARRRLELLAEVGRALASTLEIDEAISSLAELVVPALADWCIVTVGNAADEVVEVAVAHREPHLRAALQAYARRLASSLTAESSLRRVTRTGEPWIKARVDVTRLGEVIDEPEGQRLARMLAPAAVATVPLTARGRTLGALQLVNTPDRAPHSGAEIETALELGRRAALALDNARLYGRQRQLSEELQRSLMTEPPEPDHAEVIVRYAPAAQEAQVGGDWYDAFVQPHGATVLAIGDVMGHDTRAAAAMGQLRALLRGIGYHSGAAPAELLSGLDAAMRGLQVDTTASAVVARLEQTVQQMAAGVTTLRWSNAGHLPPMALHPDGTVEVLARGTPDLLLGIDPETVRHDSVVDLAHGATFLLYTDGLVERRGQSLAEGLELLRATIAELAEQPLRTLCDDVIARMLPAEAEDDVALVAVRLHSEYRGRAVGAGERRVPRG